MATVTYSNTDFADIDGNMIFNPATMDIMKVTGREAIKNSVRNIIMVSTHERLFQPGLSTFIGAALFENWDIGNRLAAETELRDVLERYEPRVKLIKISLDINKIDSNELALLVEVELIALKEYATISIIVERAR